MNEKKLKRKCDLYVSSLNDMHNIALQSYEEAENDVQRNIAKSLIQTIETCKQSFIQVFNLPTDEKHDD